MIRLWERVYNGKWKGKARFLTTVHDEINSAVSIENWEQITLDIASAMRQEVKGWRVPFEVGIELGHSWGLTFPFRIVEGRLEPSYEAVQAHETREAEPDVYIDVEGEQM